MLISDIAIAQFTSKASSAGDVAVQLGFAPDFALVIIDHGGTNPNIYWWANNASFSQWAASLAVLHTGNGGNLTRVTTASQTLDVYAGGDRITLDDDTGLRRLNGVSTTEYGDEDTDSDPKHVNQVGTAVTGLVQASSTGVSVTGANNFITQAGLWVRAEIQVASGANLVIACRGNK